MTSWRAPVVVVAAAFQAVTFVAGCDTSKAPPRTTDTAVSETGGGGGSPGSGGRGLASDDAGGGGSGGTPAGSGGRNAASGGAGSPVDRCTFSSSYAITESAGLIGTVRTTILSPPMSFVSTGQGLRLDAGATSCSPALPACRDGARVDVSDVETALLDPDVKTALGASRRMFYGDTLVADGPSFGFTLSNGRGFNVGIDCTTASATCVPTPPGVRTLVELLNLLLTQQLRDPSCAGLR